MSLIGIKLADGSFFPVIEHDVPQRKRVVLTVAREGQTGVQIDLIRRDGDIEQYVGCLVLEDLAEGVETEIELVVGLDDERNVDAKISDKGGEQYQSFSVNLDKVSAPESYSLPDDNPIEFSSDIDGVDTFEDIGLPDIEGELLDDAPSEPFDTDDGGLSNELPDLASFDLTGDTTAKSAFLDGVEISSPFDHDEAMVPGMTSDDDLFDGQIDDAELEEGDGTGILQPRTFSVLALAAIILVALSLIAFGAFGVFRWLQTDALPEVRAAALGSVLPVWMRRAERRDRMNPPPGASAR